MNMLIGVLCEVVSQVAKDEKDMAGIQLVKQTILLHLMSFDNEGNGMITKDELKHVMNDPESRSVLKQLHVDRLFLMELQELLFVTPDSAIHVKAIMELMLMCRGDLPVTVKHLAASQAAMLSSLQTVMSTLETTETNLNFELTRLTESLKHLVEL